MIRAYLVYIAALYFLGWAVRGLLDEYKKEGYTKGWLDGRLDKTTDVQVHRES